MKEMMNLHGVNWVCPEINYVFGHACLPCQATTKLNCNWDSIIMKFIPFGRSDHFWTILQLTYVPQYYSCMLVKAIELEQ